MAERWRYAGRKHPPYCTCVNCKGDGSRPPHSQPSNQLRPILEKWRLKNFDPHFILGVPPDSSRKLIVEAHRRWIIAYHPDKHNNDPLANELTKHLNAARDEYLGKVNVVRDLDASNGETRKKLNNAHVTLSEENRRKSEHNERVRPSSKDGSRLDNARRKPNGEGRRNG